MEIKSYEVRELMGKHGCWLLQYDPISKTGLAMSCILKHISKNTSLIIYPFEMKKNKAVFQKALIHLDEEETIQLSKNLTMGLKEFDL